MASSPVGLTQPPRYVLSAVTHKSLRSLLNSIRPCENGAITMQQMTPVPCTGHTVVNEIVTVPSYMKVLSSGSSTETFQRARGSESESMERQTVKACADSDRGKADERTKLLS